MTTFLESLIEQDFGIKSNGNKWARSNKHDSLVLNKEKNMFFWNSKGIRGNAVDYLIKIRGYKRSDAEKAVQNSIKIINPVLKSRKMENAPYEKLVNSTWMNGKHHRTYWYNRLLTDDTIDKNRLGFHEGWSTIPLYENGTFLNFQIRREDPKRIKYWYDNSSFSPVLYNAEILEFIDYVYITEGIVDSILLNQMGMPSVAQTGGNYYWNPKWNYLFSNVKSIIYIKDNDSAGDIHANLVANSLGTGRVRIVTLGNKEHFDTIDYFRENGTVDELREICSTKYVYSFQMNRRSK